MRASRVLLRARFDGGLPSLASRGTSAWKLVAWLRKFLEILEYFSAKRRMVALYILCALPLGIFMAMAVPLGQGPDEPAHMARAEGLLRGAVMAQRKSVDLTGVKVDHGLFTVSFGKTTVIDGRPVTTLGDYDALRNQTANHGMIFAPISNTGPYFPAAYLPATLGLALGLACNMSPFETMVLARLCMLAAALLIGAVALYITAYGEALLLCLLLVPMTVSMAGSLSQDSILISLACLSAAAMTRDFARIWGFRWLALLPLVLVLGSKPPYLPLLGIALLPLTPVGFWRRVKEMAAAALPVLIWVALISAFVVVRFGKPPYHPGPLYLGDHGVTLLDSDPHANLQILLAQPLRFLTMPLRIFTESHVGSGVWLLQDGIGILGWANCRFPDRFYAAWSFALGIALLGLVFCRRPMAAPPNAVLQGLYVGGLLILAFWAIAISQYLNWTLVGAPAIDGIQGRYFTVLAAFLLLAVPVFRGWSIPAVVPALPAFALGLYDLGYVPLKVIAFYYMY